MTVQASALLEDGRRLLGSFRQGKGGTLFDKKFRISFSKACQRRTFLNRYWDFVVEKKLSLITSALWIYDKLSIPGFSKRRVITRLPPRRFSQRASPSSWS
jgi:hypothetical protein